MSVRRRVRSCMRPCIRALSAAFLVFAVVPPRALAAQIAWTTRSDFERNASTTGDAVSLGNLRVSGDDVAGDADNGDSVTLLGPTVRQTLFAGAGSAVALRLNGLPMTTGRNEHGQLGLNHQTTVTAWADTGIGSTDCRFGIGDEHALRADGGLLYVTGGNSHGQLGVGSYSEFKTWVTPGLAATITALAAGRDHSLALGDNGHVYVAGGNARGQIGLGSGVTTQLAWTDSGITSVTAIAAGYEHSVAVKSDGSVWACGANDFGQLGLNDQSDRTSWTSAAATGAVSAACGEHHTLLLHPDGRVSGAGGFQYFELGLGSQASRLTFTDLGLSQITQVAAGRWHSLAVDSARRVWAAGNNSYGQAGRGGHVEVDTWARNDSLTGVTGVAAGDGYSLLLREDGYLYGAGRYDTGQLGFGLDGYFDYADPTMVAESWTRCGQREVAGIASAESGNSIAWKDDGSVWVIGPNGGGQLGVGANTGAYYAVFSRSHAMSGCVEAACGGEWNGGSVGHSLAVRNDGTLWVAGSNSNGQVGLGARSLTTTWTESTLTVSVDVTDVEAGGFHSMALDSAGVLWVAGKNSRGQLGLGDTTERRYFTQSMTSVMDIAAGREWSVALKTDGSVWVCGSNDWYQLGLPGVSDVTTWTQAPGLPVMQSVGTAAFQTAAMEADGPNGTVWLSGYDSWSETTMTASHAEGGFQHWLAMRTDGGVWAIGDNSWDALGATGIDGGVWNRTATGAKMLGTTNGSTMAGGGQWSLYVDSTGLLWGTGDTSKLGLYDGIWTTGGWVPIGVPRMKQPLSYAGAGTLGGTTGLRADSRAAGLGDAAAWTSLQFVYEEPRDGDTLWFQVRTADTTAALSGQSYRGPDIHGPSYYTTGTPEASTTVLPDGRWMTSVKLRGYTDPTYDDVPVSRCIEVWMYMTTRPTFDRTPVLHELRVLTEDPPGLDPGSFAQFRGSDGATVAPADWTNADITLVVPEVGLAAGATTGAVEFEVEATGGGFDGSGIVTRAVSPSGEASLALTGLAHASAWQWRARSVDDLGRRSAWATASAPGGSSFHVDAEAPAGSFHVSDGATMTASRDVTCTLGFSDDTDILSASVRFGGAGAWTALEPHGLPQKVTLPDEDRLWSIECTVADVVGNAATGSIAGGVLLDRAAPTGTVSIEGDATETSKTVVTLGCSATDLTSMQMRFSVEHGAWSAWEAYATSKVVTLPAGDGTKTVDAQFRDQLGHVLEVSDDILLDQVVEMERTAGASRYQTACRISETTFDAADTVVLATGAGFADALSAAGLAGSYDAPLLLTDPRSLPASVSAEIGRLGATKVFVVGGEGAVSASVFGAVDALPSVEASRIAGASRYDTAARVARAIAAHEGGAFCGRAFVARGDNFADALASAPLAYGLAAPVLLVRTSSLPPETADAIEDLGIADVVIAGGFSAVDAGVEAAIDGLLGVNTPVRRAGSSRYDTAAQLASYGVDRGWATWGFVGIATGLNYPDALGGGVACGARGGVMLLTHRDSLSTPARDALRDHRFEIDDVQVFGGAGAVGASTYDAIETAVER